jgi:hypothetical protein
MTMKKIVIAAVVGGLIVFVWSAIAHMATPLGTAGMSVLPPAEEAKVIDAMKGSVPASGLYFFPGMDMRSSPTPEQQQEWQSKIAAGPYGLLIYNARGGSPMSAAQLMTELLSNIVAAGIAAFLVGMIAGTPMQRATAVTLFALFASISLSVSYWNWYGFPTAFVAGELVTELVGWFLAGLAIARIVPPQGVPARARVAA